MLEAQNEASYEPPPWESQPDEMGVVDSTTTNAQQDPHLQEMIATAEEEVRSLRPSSSVYSDSTASVYSSLSRHSRRMSLIVEELPMSEVMTASERRKSSALSIRNSHLSGPSNLSLVPEAYQQLNSPRPPTRLYSPEPSEAPAKALKDHGPEPTEDPEKAFKDLRTFPPACSDQLLSLALIYSYSDEV